ncbi:MAG: hypothetical protein A6F70_02465 [Cycloclasticus sp. symbiont of Bathymodiolus heckerae]|nr:MAG: hypothetical protein A6F70_02465 [Cycloclasticus sp. symbiont of Bathymodiolus heckerae]
MSVDIDLVRKLPMFKSASGDLLSAVASTAQIQTIAKGQQIAYEGMSSDWFFVVLSGDIRVYKMSESGKEITLFNIADNESCILTIFSILSQKKYPAFASTQTELTALMIPAAPFKQWVDQHSALRDHIFSSLSGRLTDILDTFDQVIFQRMDSRIAKFILNKCNDINSKLMITHEQFSHELGTNRVVVSRILEAFAEEGAIALNRGCITLIDKNKLLEK